MAFHIFFFSAGLRDPIACSFLGGGSLSHKSGYNITRLCPYLCQFFSYFIFPCRSSLLSSLQGGYSSSPLHSAPLDPLTPLDSSSPPGSAFDSESDSDSASETVAASAVLFFTPSKSIPAYSHHLRYTLAPGRRLDRSQRSRIGCVAIYCATVFCLLVTDFLISLKPASPIVSSNVG